MVNDALLQTTTGVSRSSLFFVCGAFARVLLEEPTARVQSHIMSGLQAVLLLASDSRQLDMLADADVIGETTNIGVTLMDKLIHTCGWLDTVPADGAENERQSAPNSRNSVEETYQDALTMVSQILAMSQTRAHSWILRDSKSPASELKHELAVLEKILRPCTARANGAARSSKTGQNDETDALLIVNSWMRAEPGQPHILTSRSFFSKWRKIWI